MIHIAPEKPEDIGYIHETNSQVFETDAEARLVDKLIGVDVLTIFDEDTGNEIGTFGRKGLLIGE